MYHIFIAQIEQTESGNFPSLLLQVMRVRMIAGRLGSATQNGVWFPTLIHRGKLVQQGHLMSPREPLTFGSFSSKMKQLSKRKNYNLYIYMLCLNRASVQAFYACLYVALL